MTDDRDYTFSHNASDGVDRTCSCPAFGMKHGPAQCRVVEFYCDPHEWARWGVWRMDPHDDGEGGEA